VTKLALALQYVRVHNRQRLLDLVLNRPPGQSLITVSNHISVVDDPAMWGKFTFTLWAFFFFFKCANVRIFFLIDRFSLFFSPSSLILEVATLPFKHVSRPEPVRWITGAKEIAFTNPLTTWIFSSGKVIPIIRGAGIDQEAVHFCMDRLREGQWVHIFSEGKVNQTGILKKLRWGIGKLTTATEPTPIVLPIYIRGEYGMLLPLFFFFFFFFFFPSHLFCSRKKTLNVVLRAHIGFEKIMPEWRIYIPRFFQEVDILIGEPISMDFIPKPIPEHQGPAKLKLYSDITHAIEKQLRLLEEQMKRK
jgi:1-acyl-sn-glycerol-3-phosphate acyltransferase